MADHTHTYWYKILDSAPPHPLPETLPTTELDAKDGFIHLSTAKQIPITAGLFFKNATKLWLLQLRPKDLDGEVRIPLELPGCPHIHHSQRGLGKRNIESVIQVERPLNAEWSSTQLANLEE